jgi:hypothetical protein
MAMSDDLRAKVRDLMPALRSDLEDLVRIQSVSADPARAGEVWRSADAVAELLRAEGFADGGGTRKVRPVREVKTLGPSGKIESCL